MFILTLTLLIIYISIDYSHRFIKRNINNFSHKICGMFCKTYKNHYIIRESIKNCPCFNQS